MVIVFSFVTIRIKARKRRNITNFSNTGEGKKVMADTITETSYRKQRIHREGNISEIKNTENSPKLKMKIYTVYNPESNPNFYLHNKIAWYKNFR